MAMDADLEAMNNPPAYRPNYYLINGLHNG